MATTSPTEIIIAVHVHAYTMSIVMTDDMFYVWHKYGWSEVQRSDVCEVVSDITRVCQVVVVQFQYRSVKN